MAALFPYNASRKRKFQHPPNVKNTHRIKRQTRRMPAAITRRTERAERCFRFFFIFRKSKYIAENLCKTAKLYLLCSNLHKSFNHFS